MRPDSYHFLQSFLNAASPSGFEQPAQNIFREYIQEHVDEVQTDILGNTSGLIRGRSREKLTVMLAGHCDEVGFMAKFIDENGFIYFSSIGGVDEQLLPGKRVWVHTQKGPIRGVVGRKPIHLIDPKERETGIKIQNLFIDIGAENKKDAEKTVRIGDPLTFADNLEKLLGDRVVGRGMDDKIGSFIVAEVLRRIRQSRQLPFWNVYGVSTVQEEIGLRGATTSAYQIQPDVGIAVEVGHASDYPEVDKKRTGEYKLGSGPILARGANINPAVFNLLEQTAKKMSLPVQILGEPRATGTDANVIQLSRKGVATGLVKVPLRYMHTPVEVLSLRDLETACELLVGFIYALKEGMNFVPR